MTMKDRAGEAVHKNFPATITKTDVGAAGGFDALVSVFDVEDSAGDVVVAGAFAGSLGEWGDRPIPVLWSHQMWDLTSFIGKATAEETEQGLLIHGEFLDTESAQLVRKLMTEGLVTEFSWSGRIREGAWVETDTDSYYEIRAVELWEAGPCFKGANPATELLSVKTRDAPTAPPPSDIPPDDPDQKTEQTTKAPDDSGAFVVPAHLAARLALSATKGIY